MTKEKQRLTEKLLARYSEAFAEMLRRCREKEDFGELEEELGELEEEVERLAQATLPRAQRRIPVGAVWGMSRVSVQRWQCAGCGCNGQRRPKGLG